MSLNSTITTTLNTTTSNNNNHHHHHHHSRISNGTQACAACKYQRRKCSRDCALAPYFPYDRQKQFLNAHKLFGVSNITKIIRNLKPHEKDIAMNTIIYQSDMRAKDPVGGCYRQLLELQHQIAYCKAEFDFVLQQIELCKAQVYQQQLLHQVEVVGSNTNTNNNNNNNNNQGNNEIISCDNVNDNYQQYQSLMRCYYYDEVDQGNNEGQQQYMPTNNIIISQQHDHDHHRDQNNNNNNDQYSWVAPPNEDAVLASSNSSTSHGDCFAMKNNNEFGGGGECDGLDMKQQIQINVNGSSDPYGDNEREYGSKFDDSSTHVDLSCCDIQEDDQLKFGLQQTTQLREDVVLKQENIVLGNPEDESFQQICEDDLRNAATLFTLTS